MGFALTSTAIRSTPMIGLTGDSPLHTAVPSPRPFVTVQQLPIPREEARPSKRRRVDDGATRPKRSLKQCFHEQVLPHVDAVVRGLDPAVYRIKDIGGQATAALVRSPRLRIRLDQTKYNLSPQDEEEIKVRAQEEVLKLLKLKVYLVRRDTPSRSTSESSAVPENKEHHDSLQPKRASAPAVPPPSEPQPPSFQRPPYRPNRKEPRPDNKWLQLSERPYRVSAEREAIAKGAKHLVKAARGVASEPTVYHVDFTADEVAHIAKCLATYESDPVPSTLEAIALRCHRYNIPSIVQVESRSVEDIRNFCSDLLAGQVSPLQSSRLLSLSQDVDNQRVESRRSSRIPSLLLAREIEGNIGFGRMRRYENFQNEFKKAREDGLQVVAEFTNAAGDITTGSWVSESNFICGTTAHSDTHNQQYNKPGNLLLCSTTSGTLRSFPNHRIPRPFVEKGENSTDAMRRSQDPWLYSSVVSSDYDKHHNLAYTSSFDKTVRVWKVSPDGKLMEAQATWQHTGNVNFVAAAKDGSGRVATAADSPTEAVRIYTVDPNNEHLSEASYDHFSCSRTDAADSDKWAYFPATMQWGQNEWTHHLLLVGYSPRSMSGDDQDIPEDKRSSGEITLWDAASGRRLPVMTASTANVFEVAWHPTLARFIVATTPTGPLTEHGVRTQIHVFQFIEGAYSQYQALGCYAADINELTFVPNSIRGAYITAACTDGKVYVWDTAQGDKPIHVLKHGDPLEDVIDDREKEDTGVKFTAWGTSPDRFYTGASDGVVKVWNVRNKRKPLVRTLLEAPGPIAFGAFSPDYSKLAIGDATGRLYILSVDKRDEHDSHYITFPDGRRVRRSKPLIPHPEPPAPAPEADPDDTDDESDDAGIATYSHRTYIDSRQLLLNSNPVVGAVQGPRYSSTGLFRSEAHFNGDPSLPLLADFERHQKESEALSRGGRRRSLRRIKNPSEPDERLEAVHEENLARDLNVEELDRGDISELVREGALLSIDEDWGFSYEELPNES
ncbi:Fc.00g007610.m01.CDS01 [Cosmosporella sp. VM-42]